jgi:hypothetical protein
MAFPVCAGRHNFRLKKGDRMTITLVNRAALHAGTAGQEPPVNKRTGTIMPHALSDLPDLDNHRIQTLRTLLQEDTYVINIRHLASKIMDFEVALDQAQNDPS